MDRLWTNLIVVSNASDAVLNYCGPPGYIYIIDAFSRKDSLGIIITIAVCFYNCDRGVYGTRGDAVAGIGILRNITVSRTTILLTYLSLAVRCHVTE